MVAPLTSMIRPLGRILRDARINQIGEGSNEVLTSFIALVGMRGPGMEFKEIYDNDAEAVAPGYRQSVDSRYESARRRGREFPTCR